MIVLLKNWIHLSEILAWLFFKTHFQRYTKQHKRKQTWQPRWNHFNSILSTDTEPNRIKLDHANLEVGPAIERITTPKSTQWVGEAWKSKHRATAGALGLQTRATPPPSAPQTNLSKVFHRSSYVLQRRISESRACLYIYMDVHTDRNEGTSARWYERDELQMIENKRQVRSHGGRYTKPLDTKLHFTSYTNHPALPTKSACYKVNIIWSMHVHDIHICTMLDIFVYFCTGLLMQLLIQVYSPVIERYKSRTDKIRTTEYLHTRTM